jgi:predicted XRE-type DNA-binding protein
VEVMKDFRGDTFRAVYTLRLRGSGLFAARVSEEIEDWAGDIAPGNGAYPAALARSRTDRRGERVMSKRNYETGSRNVFRDLELPNADEHLVKAQLVYRIDSILKARSLTQVEAAKRFGISQPDVSKMLRGEFRQFSVERLLRFLVALNHDVEIVIKPHRGTKEAATLVWWCVERCAAHNQKLPHAQNSQSAKQ